MTTNGTEPEGRTSEYEDITRGHPWKRCRGTREILNCRNCLLDLELMGDVEDNGREAPAARIMPSAATRIGGGMEPSSCPGRTVPGSTGYFLRKPGGSGMVRVQPDVFYRSLWRNNPLG